MLLGFKKEFALGVQTGAKQTTIRAARKKPPKIGEICHCYTHLRTKDCRLLGRWTCVDVSLLKIFPTKYQPDYPLQVFRASGGVMSLFDMERMFTRDGFYPDGRLTATQKAAGFWNLNSKGMAAHFIRWEWTAEGAAPTEHHWGDLDHKGEFDELWISDAFVHIERMNDTGFWMGLEAPGLPRVSVNTGVYRGKWYFNVYEDRKDGKSFSVERPRRK